VCAQFLNYTTRYIGSIEDDKLILEGHRKYAPVLDYAPSSVSSRSFIRLANSITQIPQIDVISGGMQFFVERLVRQHA
jgi:MinD-like ATPase involved in chromosome partitioning or flagellar assembly